MIHDPNRDELARLVERLEDAQRNLHQAYDRLDILAREVEGLTGEVVTFKGQMAMRSDLLLALNKAEHAARIAAAEMRKTETAIGIATAAR